MDDLCAGDRAHGIVERAAENLDVEVDGVAGHASVLTIDTNK